MEEAYKVDFKFEISLQQICMVKIASSLWENKDTKQKRESFLKEIYKNSENFQGQNILHWNKLMKEVLSLIKNLPLPNQFRSKLKHITRSMGIKIFSWISYITNKLPVDSICIQNLFWTQYGTLDKVQIFKIWVEKRRLENDELFNIACFFYLKDYISILWKKISKDVRESEFYSKTIYEESAYSHIAYWKNYLEENNKYFETSVIQIDREIRKASRDLPIRREIPIHELLEYNMAQFSIFRNPRRNPHVDGFEQNMIKLSLFQGQEFAIRHFWDKLDDVRGEKVLHYIRYMLQKEFVPEYTDVIIFLVINMFMKESYKFSTEESFGLFILLSNHPWDEFYLTFLDRISKSYPPSDYGGERKLDFLYLIKKIVELMDHEFELYGSVENSVYQNFLSETWKRIPRWAKLVEVESWNIKFNELLSKLLLIEDIQSLKFIINGEEFRSELCARIDSVLWAYLGNPCLFMILTDRQIELLNKLLDEIELKEDERSGLKAKYCEFIYI